MDPNSEMPGILFDALARARRQAIERELAREEGGCSAVWRDASPATRRVDRQMFEGFSREELDLLAAGLILGMGFGNFQSAGQAVSLSLVSKSRFAQATTTFFIFFDLGIGLGPYLFGFMIPAAGYDGMYQTLAFVVLGAVALYYVLHGRRVAAA